MLDAKFTHYSPGSLRLYHFEAHDHQAQLTAEIRRTVDAIAGGAPARIASGRSTTQEAEAVMFLWLAIAQDLDAQDQWLAAGRGAAGWSLADKLRELRAANGVAWEDKVQALRRELETRRAQYPADVDKGRLTGDQAKAQLERLEAVHDLYWRHCYAFDGTRDELRALTGPILDQAIIEQGVAQVQPCGDSSTRASGDQPEDSGSTPLPRSTAGAGA